MRDLVYRNIVEEKKERRLSFPRNERAKNERERERL